MSLPLKYYSKRWIQKSELMRLFSMKYVFPKRPRKKPNLLPSQNRWSTLFVNLMSVLSTEFERPAVKCNEGYNHHSVADNRESLFPWSELNGTLLWDHVSVLLLILYSTETKPDRFEFIFASRWRHILSLAFCSNISTSSQKVGSICWVFFWPSIIVGLLSVCDQKSVYNLRERPVILK